MLTRSEFCKVTGVKNTQLSMMLKREQLPFIDTEETAGETATATEDTHGWRRYKINDALRLIVMNQLTEKESKYSTDVPDRLPALPKTAAAKAVCNSIGTLIGEDDNFSAAELLGENIDDQKWIVVRRDRDRSFEQSVSEDEPHTFIGGHYAGTMVEIFEALRESEKFDARFGHRSPMTQLVWSNVSEAYRLLLWRAEKYGIDLFQSEGSPVVERITKSGDDNQ